MSEAVTIPVLNEQGEVVRQVEVPAAVTARAVKPTVVHQTVVAQAANRRRATAHTKTRAEVSGGGIKPWRQKGTGRARHGSIRSPLWVGGGVVFGPRSDRNYGHRLPQQVKRAALRMVVTDYAASGRIVAVEAFPQSTKTKSMVAWLKTLKFSPQERVLVLLSDSERAAARALKNVPQVELMAVRQLNPYDGLRATKWLVSAATLPDLFNISA